MQYFNNTISIHFSILYNFILEYHIIVLVLKYSRTRTILCFRSKEQFYALGPFHGY